MVPGVPLRAGPALGSPPHVPSPAPPLRRASVRLRRALPQTARMLHMPVLQDLATAFAESVDKLNADYTRVTQTEFEELDRSFREVQSFCEDVVRDRYEVFKMGPVQIVAENGARPCASSPRPPPVALTTSPPPPTALSGTRPGPPPSFSGFVCGGGDWLFFGGGGCS